MKHISKKRQPVDGLLMILIFSLVFSGLFQVVLAFSNQGVADVMTFNYVWATTPIDNIFHLYSIIFNPFLIHFKSISSIYIQYPEMIPLHFDQPILLHFPQFIRHCRPVYSQIICKLLPVIRNIELFLFTLHCLIRQIRQ